MGINESKTKLKIAHVWKNIFSFNYCLCQILFRFMYSRTNYLIYVRFGREQYIIRFVYRMKIMINIDYIVYTDTIQKWIIFNIFSNFNCNFTLFPNFRFLAIFTMLIYNFSAIEWYKKISCCNYVRVWSIFGLE